MIWWLVIWSYICTTRKCSQVISWYKASIGTREMFAFVKTPNWGFTIRDKVKPWIKSSSKLLDTSGYYCVLVWPASDPWTTLVQLIRVYQGVPTCIKNSIPAWDQFDVNMRKLKSFINSNTHCQPIVCNINPKVHSFHLQFVAQLLLLLFTCEESKNFRNWHKKELLWHNS